VSKDSGQAPAGIQAFTCFRFKRLSQKDNQEYEALFSTIVQSQPWPFPANRDDSSETGLSDVEGLEIITAKTAVGQSPVLHDNL
jgi:hypothetical protein